VKADACLGANRKVKLSDSALLHLLSANRESRHAKAPVPPPQGAAVQSVVDLEADRLE
jgi:hypothetical protein